MTYVEAISEIQKRSVDALKVVQSVQIASLQATLDLTEALIAPPIALLGVPPFMSAMANLTRSVAFQLLDQQIACAKNVTETLVGPIRSLSSAPVQPLALNATEPLALTATEPLEALPVVTEIAVLTTTLERVDDAERVGEAILVEPTQAVDLREGAPIAGEPEQAADTQPAALGEAVELQTRIAEPAAASVDTDTVATAKAARQPDVAEPPAAEIATAAEPLDSAPAPRASAAKPSGKKPKTPTSANNRARPKRRPSS